MTTKYTDIFDVFMLKIKDWKLEYLFRTSPDDFENILKGFMVISLLKFRNCTQDLSRDDAEKEFLETLSEDNIEVIASLMVESWLEREVQDIRQMALHLQDDFKTYAEANNLKEKSEHWSKVKEINSQTLVDYSLDKRDLWSDWLSGNFYDPNR